MFTTELRKRTVKGTKAKRKSMDNSQSQAYAGKRELYNSEVKMSDKGPDYTVDTMARRS